MKTKGEDVINAVADAKYAVDKWTPDKYITKGRDDGKFNFGKLAVGDKITITITFDKDENEHPGPDKYEVKITYNIVHGKWKNGATTMEKYVVKYDAEGQRDVNGTATLGDSIPTKDDVIPDSGYRNRGSWDPEAKADTKVTAPATFTLTLGKDVPPPPVKYTLTYKDGGKTVDTEEYSAGTVVTLNKSLTKEGFVFTGWYEDSALTKKITKITMDSDKTVYAGWTQNAVGAPKSDDLNYDDHIAYINGYPDGSFGPNKNITRAETAAMIYRLLTDARRNAITTTANSFSDVDASKWYNTEVSSMANGGYIKGYPDGTFGGEKPITRAEFVAILMRFFPESNATCNFSDVSASHWAYRYIAAATSYGWVTGYPDGSFKPDQPITRAEAVAVINRVLNRGVSAGSELGSFKNFTDNTNANAWYYYEIIEAANSHDAEGSRPNENWSNVNVK